MERQSPHRQRMPGPLQRAMAHRQKMPGPQPGEPVESTTKISGGDASARASAVRRATMQLTMRRTVYAVRLSNVQLTLYSVQPHNTTHANSAANLGNPMDDSG